jgi:hypothetical protein
MGPAGPGTPSAPVSPLIPEINWPSVSNVYLIISLEYQTFLIYIRCIYFRDGHEIRIPVLSGHSDIQIRI